MLSWLQVRHEIFEPAEEEVRTEHSIGSDQRHYEQRPMKVIYIHHFPYRHLPGDFSSRYTESVVTNPYFDLVDPGLVHADLRHALDEAMHAARAGFDAVAVTEHSQSSYDMSPNPDLAAAAFAYATEGERLETGFTR